MVEEIRAVIPELGARAEQELLREVRVAPTLVKYADPNQYEIETRRELRQAARELMGDVPIAPAQTLVDLLDEEPLEVEMATTLVYEHSHYPYRQIRQAVQAAGESRFAARSSISACDIAASMMRCCVRSAPDSSSASTS